MAGIGPNPADNKRLVNKPIEGYSYDRASHCDKHVPPGMKALIDWLGRHTDGESWGTYRCEKLSKGSYSLHAENRAVDWHMDAREHSMKKQALRLIKDRLLASDRHGNRNALARRMGIQGIIYDCRAWFFLRWRARALRLLLQRPRQADQGRRPDRGPHRPHPHRAERGGRRQAHVLLAQRHPLAAPARRVRARWQDPAMFPVYRGFSRPPGRFGLVLFVILVAIVFQLAAPDSQLTRLIALLLQAAVVVLALYAAGADRRLVAVALGGAALIAAIASGLLLGFEVGPETPRLITLFLVLAAPGSIAIGLRRELRRDKGRVRFQTVFAGLCLYLLVGLGGAFLFASIQDLSNDPFFAEKLTSTPNDFLYYSFATLTTTGYGDLSAATDLGRAASITEALAGQIYLVTVIAVLVGNLGRRRS